MRTLVTVFGRFIACFVMLAMLTSNVAMAAYVCPKTSAGADAMNQMLMAPQAEQMGNDMPAHCAERQAGDKQALEQSGVPPVPALPAIVSMQLLAAAAPAILQAARLHADAPRYLAHAPPFLRTQRLRI